MAVSSLLYAGWAGVVASDVPAYACGHGLCVNIRAVNGRRRLGLRRQRMLVRQWLHAVCRVVADAVMKAEKAGRFSLSHR